MAKLTNPWVGYLDRSYKTIKSSLLNRLGKLVPEMSDHSESNVMIIVLDAIAGVTETLNYYIDNIARESFSSTARRYSSLVKLSRGVDYRIKANIAASVDIYVNFFDEDGNPGGVTADFTIPKNTRFFDETGIDFISTELITVSSGDTSVIIPCQQKTFIDNDNLGTLEGIEDETLLLPEDYVHNSISILINGETWVRQETLAFSLSTDKHFIVEVSTDKRAYIQFGDGINGQLAPGTFDVLADYFTTTGEDGNIDSNLINDSDFDFNIQSIDTVNINNPLSSTGGNTYESLASLRKSIPLSVRTLGGATTRQSFIDIGTLSPGVTLADVGYECGDPYVKVFVYPDNGGIAQQALLTDVEAYFEDRIMFPLIMKAFPMGESRLIIDAEVTGLPRKKEANISSQIQTALESKYGLPDKQALRTIRTSDIIAEIDNQLSVDYLILNNFYIIPFLNPVDHSYSVEPTLFTVMGYPDQVTEYEIKYSGSTSKEFGLYKNNLLVQGINGVEYTDPDNIFTINMPDIDLTDDDISWTIKFYPKGDTELLDYSLPIFDWDNSNIIINEIN